MLFEALLDVIVQEVEIGYSHGEDEEMTEVLKNFGIHVMKKAYNSKGPKGRKRPFDRIEVKDEIDYQSPEDVEMEE